MPTIWLSVNTEGEVTTHDTKGSLAEYQAVVGGYIEPVDTDDYTIFINEEGLLLGLEPNWPISHLAGQFLVGDVAVVGKPDRFGNTSKLTKLALAEFGLE